MIRRLSIIALALSSVALCMATSPEDSTPGDSTKATRIVISKQSLTLTLLDSDNRTICAFPVAVGRNLGNKSRVGDRKTPEGEFTIRQIQPAASWSHDYGDGQGAVKGCYGNWFIRLDTPPHKGIGIHGTHTPEAVGSRSTEGSIRLRNSDLDSLQRMVRVGMTVLIEPSEEDILADAGVVSDAAEATIPTVDIKPDEVVRAELEAAAKAEAEAAAKSADRVEAVGEVWHTIASGEIIGSLAIKYGVSSAQILELNPDINERNLQIGQRIRIK